MSWPFQSGWLPPGWRPTKLRSFLTRRKRTKHPDLQLLSVNLPQGVVPRQEGDGRAAPSLDLDGYQEVRPNDLVINQLGKPHGALGVSAHHGIISPAYFVAEISEEADPRFVHHLLRTRLYISEYERRGKCMPPSQFDISWEQFRDISVTLPPLAEQRMIADYLDTETARIDTVISTKRHLIELLEERVDSIVFDGIRGRLTSSESPVVPSGIDWLGNIPQHFGTPWLGAHHTTQLGKMLNMNAASGPEQYSYLKNTNVKWDHFDLEDLPTMTFDADDRRRCELRPGDVVVCEGGEVGRSAVWSHHGEIFFQKALHRVRPVTKNVPCFLMYCLWSAAKLNVFAVEGNQSTIVHLTGEKLREHRFPWPPLDEQDRIVSLIDAERGRINQAVKQLEMQILLLAERRQALITSVVIGEIPVPSRARSTV